METPDKWIIIKIGDDEGLAYKVFASFYGGYLGSNSWKMNSGITKVEEDDKSFMFHGHSSSVYRCIKGAYGTNFYSQGVLSGIIDTADTANISLEVLSEDSDWIKLIS